MSTDRLRRTFAVLRPWLILALVCVGFSLHPRFLHTFWTRSYLPTIAQQAAGNVVLAVGMTFVIMTAGIDLSVGSVLALSGVTLGLTVTSGPPWYLVALVALPFGVIAAGIARRRLKTPAVTAIAVAGWLVAGFIVHALTAGGVRLEMALFCALALGAGCGALNGLFATLGRVPSFVVTLGMLTAARGLTVYATGGMSVSGLPPRLSALGQGWPLVVIATLTVIAGVIVLHHTRLGRYLVAVGGNREAARLSGVDLVGTELWAYVIAGLCAGIAAILTTAKFAVADTGAGTNAELNAIAAVVIGGTSLSGGQGSVVGSLVGALTIAVLNAGLVLVGVRDTLQGVVVGAVIVVCVMIDGFQRR